MSVETCCSYENKNRRKRRRGESQSILSSLHEICTVEYFKATPLEEFSHRCRDCLKQNVKLSSTTAVLDRLSSASNPSDNKNSYQYLRYDRLEIIRRLTNDIDWRNLCEHHDKREYKLQYQDTNRSLKTALSEIVLAMTDPMVTPRCCHNKCLIDVLLNALLMSPSLSVSLQQRRISSSTTTTNTIPRWTPSQQFLLGTIRRLLLSERMELDSSMSDYVRNFVVSRPPFLSATGRDTTGSTTYTSTMSPNKANRLLSAIYWMLSSSLSAPSLPLFWERELVSSGLLLLQRIDGWSIEIETESGNRHIWDEDNRSRNRCGFCKKDVSDNQTSKNDGLRRPINRKMTAETLSNLHDDDMNIEKRSTFFYYNKTPWRRSYGDHQKQVSLKDVLSVNKKNGSASTKRCLCNRNNNSRNPTLKEVDGADSIVLSSDWSTVRSRAYKKFLSHATERRQQQHLGESFANFMVSPRTMQMQNSDEAFLWWLVNETALHPEHSSRRACIALVAHSLGGPKNPCYFKYIAHLFWQGYLISSRQGMSSSSQWLRLYSEWLSECAVFDHREIVWEAFQPIRQHITDYLLSNQHEQLEDQHNLEPSLLACLGYILHHRSYLFETCRCDEKDPPSDENSHISKSSIENEFRSFMNLLSIHCGESSELWLGQFFDSIRDLVESTLQRLGVLSFALTDPRRELGNNAPSVRSQGLHESPNVLIDSMATSNWPFREEFSLRKAMGRIDRAVLSLENGNHVIESLLSHYSKACQIIDKNTKVVDSSKTKVSTAPMTDYLYDDGILCLIFSFCGPKRLTKIPLVCKAWKIVSDVVSNSLWESAYAAKFGKYRWPSLDAERRHRVSTCAIDAIDFEDASKKSEEISQTYWKNLFTQKQIAEKMVRFQRNPRSGYKYTTCNYVGCLHILKTAEQERKHDKMHLRVIAKEQAASKKKSQKRKGKNEKKSALQDKKIIRTTTLDDYRGTEDK